MHDEALAECTVSGFAQPTLPGHHYLGPCLVCSGAVYGVPPRVIDSSGALPSFSFVHYACEPGLPEPTIPGDT